MELGSEGSARLGRRENENEEGKWGRRGGGAGRKIGLRKAKMRLV